LKKILIILSLATALPTLMLVWLAIRAHTDETARLKSTAKTWELGQGSLRFDRQSSVTQPLNLSPEIADRAVPTNQWWSSLLTGNWPETLVNLPFSTQVNKNGFSTGVPVPVATADRIQATFTPDITLRSTGGTNLRGVRITGYDIVSVSFDVLRTDGQVAYSARLVKGVPFVYLTYRDSVELSSSTALEIRRLSDGRSAIGTTVGGRQYAAYIDSNIELKTAGPAKVLIANPAHEAHITLAAIPSGGVAGLLDQFDSASSSAITGASVEHATIAQTVKSTISWHTKEDVPQLYYALPHQTGAAEGATALATLNTIRGQAKLLRGNVLTYHTPLPQAPEMKLPSNDTFFQRDKLEQYLTQTVAALPDSAGASYNGGKELFRLANLLKVAKTANSATAAVLQQRLKHELEDWLSYKPGETSKYFAYDAKMRGIVAITPEFGSEKYNDHHFHYGYMIYAAGILAGYDPAFLTNYGPAVDRLVDDIADTSDNNPHAPYLREFDVYEGHSWADGLDHFADGNNQESSSEAVNAWYAVYLWGKVSQQSQTTAAGQWLYANEAKAALSYNYNSKQNPWPTAYKHHQISMLWGAKAEWATWFSDRPEAKHGITLLPLSAGSVYLNNGANLADDLAALTAELGGAAPSSWADPLGMAEAMTNPARAKQAFNPTGTLDNSNSLPYYYFWVAWWSQHPGGAS
jgi:endoglucanase Acf2